MNLLLNTKLSVELNHSYSPKVGFKTYLFGDEMVVVVVIACT
jgi:hypothetical protein